MSPHKTRGKYFVVVALFFQMLTNALQLRTSVMSMLTALTPMVDITVRVNRDIPEIDTTAQVRSITSCSNRDHKVMGYLIHGTAFAGSPVI